MRMRLKHCKQLTRNNIIFNWATECQENSEELKTLLRSRKVQANYYDPARQSRLYVDDGPAGIPATVAQLHDVEGLDHPVWRQVTHTCRAKTTAEMNYSKVDGKSLTILSGIHSNKMYLYVTEFTVVVNHEH